MSNRIEKINDVFRFRFRYDPVLVAAVKALPGRKYDPATRTWSVPAGPHVAGDVLAFADTYGFEVDPSVKNAGVDQTVKESLPADFKLITKQDPPAWEHQKRMVAYAQELPAALWHCGMGTGKTRAAVDFIQTEGFPVALVLCPLAVVPTWEKQIKEFAVKDMNPVALGKNFASIAKKLEAAQFSLDISRHRREICVLIINYESAWREPFRDWALKQEWPVVILDEGHNIKAPAGKASRFCALLGKKAGKRLALTGTPLPHALESATPIFTPQGTKEVGDFQVGDFVIGSDGEPTEVIGVWPQGTKAVFRVSFSDSTEIECTEDHLWKVSTRSRRARGLDWLIKSTKEIVEHGNLFDEHGAARWHIPLTLPVHFNKQALPVDPYVLGVLIGDGHLGHGIDFKKPDMFVRDEVRKRLPDGLQLTPHGDYGYRITSGKQGGSLPGKQGGPKKNEIACAIDILGLRYVKSPERFIPPVYLFNDVPNRLDMLRGLCDTDGSSLGSTTRFTTTSKKLIDDFIFLVRSLGGHGKMTIELPKKTKLPQGTFVMSKTKYTFMFRIDINPFLSPIKATKYKQPWRRPRKNILSIVRVGEKDATCITVKAEDGLFVAKDFIVTHNSPLDAYGLCRTLDPTIFGTSFHRFKMRYAVMGGFQNKQVMTYQRMDEFQERLNRIRIHVSRDVLDLPEAVHMDIPCTLSPASARLYTDLENEFYAQVEAGEITTDNALTRLLRLQQVTSGHIKTDEGEVKELSSSKAEALETLFQGISNDEPIVVFCRFTHDIQTVAKVAAKTGRQCLELSGKKKELEAWQAGKAPVLAAQIKTAREGVDMTRARYCVYYSLGFSLSDYEQSLARTHRPGQTRTVFYYHLVTKGTVDVRVYAALKSRKSVIETILGGRNGHAS